LEKVLDVRNSDQVSSPTVLDADLGVGDRHLLVMSGIAIYDWEIDTDQTAMGEARVLLGVYARDLEQATPFVGLASIANDGSEYVFATDSARVDLNPDTGELSLYLRTALMGDSSYFYRISYQVVATVVRIGAYVDGTISWPTSLRRPASDDPSLVAPLLTVVANHREMTPGDAFFRPMEKLTPVSPGQIESLSVGDDRCEAKYRIDNPPMAMPLKVTVAISPDFAPGDVVAGRVSGPDVFTLSPSQPSTTVDFAVSAIELR
jgi:hypothetical protein